MSKTLGVILLGATRPVSSMPKMPLLAHQNQCILTGHTEHEMTPHWVAPRSHHPTLIRKGTYTKRLSTIPTLPCWVNAASPISMEELHSFITLGVAEEKNTKCAEGGMTTLHRGVWRGMDRKPLPCCPFVCCRCWRFKLPPCLKPPPPGGLTLGSILAHLHL